jgi:hypothetical protein
VLGDLAARALVLAEQIEQRSGILPLETFLHVLRRDPSTPRASTKPA